MQQPPANRVYDPNHQTMRQPHHDDGLPIKSGRTMTTSTDAASTQATSNPLTPSPV